MSPSKVSLRRYSVFLENSPATWHSMVTLTFRSRPEKPKAVFRKWLLNQPWHETSSFCYSWFLEFQRRKVVHFHVLLSKEAFGAYWGNEHSWLETVGRGRKRRTVLRGSVDRWIVDSWIDAVGDASSKFAAFQNGGIIEPVRSENGAARYAAKYASKHEQKVLPETAPPLGRWWYLSRKAAPQAEGMIEAHKWPYSGRFSLLYDKTAVMEKNPTAVISPALKKETKHESEANRIRKKVCGQVLHVRGAGGQRDDAN